MKCQVNLSHWLKKGNLLSLRDLVRFSKPELSMNEYSIELVKREADHVVVKLTHPSRYELTLPRAYQAAVKFATDQGIPVTSSGLFSAPYPITKDGIPVNVNNLCVDKPYAFAVEFKLYTN